METVDPKELVLDRNIRSSIDTESSDFSDLCLSMKSRIEAGLLPNAEPIVWYYLRKKKIVWFGHRRALAAQVIGAKSVASSQTDPPVTTTADILGQLVSNDHRQALNPIDEGKAIITLIEEGMSQKEIANLLGKGRGVAWVSVRVALVKKTASVLQDAIASGETHFQAIHMATQLPIEQQEKYAQQIIAGASTAQNVVSAKNATKRLRLSIEEGHHPTDKEYQEAKETEKKTREQVDESPAQEEEEPPEQAVLHYVEQLLSTAASYVQQAKESAKEGNLDIDQQLESFKRKV